MKFTQFFIRPQVQFVSKYNGYKMTWKNLWKSTIYFVSDWFLEWSIEFLCLLSGFQISLSHFFIWMIHKIYDQKKKFRLLDISMKFTRIFHTASSPVRFKVCQVQNALGKFMKIYNLICVRLILRVFDSIFVPFSYFQISLRNFLIRTAY